MTEAARKPNLIDRTLGFIGRRVRDAAGSAMVRITGEVRPGLPDDDLPLLRRLIADCIDARGGEVSARTRAADLAQTYRALNGEGRRRFLHILATELGAEEKAVAAAIDALQSAAPGRARQMAEADLRQSLLPRRVELLRQFNGVEGGIKFLVDMRAELLADLGRNRDLRPLDHDFRELLTGWFDVGFLSLERITWNAPAALLEKLISYEAVHAIRSWTDLKNRLDSDRRCYAFFHPRMPEEPLIFVEVALVEGISGAIQPLLDEAAPAGDVARADTAIFYSISNCQTGLAGVSFGNFLIKRVVETLRRDLPHIKVFSTLSPIPGFRRWIDGVLARPKSDRILLADELKAVMAVSPGIEDGTRLRTLLSRSGWHEDKAVVAALAQPMARLCARYLAKKRLGRRASGRALDRVAHFHLSNGARIERINWQADLSASGLSQSYGLMVNYRYKLKDIEANHEAYTAGGQVALAGAVKRLLKG